MFEQLCLLLFGKLLVVAVVALRVINEQQQRLIRMSSYLTTWSISF